MKAWVYGIALALVRFLVGLLYPLKLTGLEHVPGEGALILCANHIANQDPVLMAVMAKKRHVHFMAKAELFKFKPLVPLLRALGVIPVKRGEADMGALRASMAVLKEGHVLGIFAQGHRDRTGEMAMESGVALLALRMKAPVVPVYFAGPYRMFRRMRVCVGPAVDLSDYVGRYDGEMLRAATAKIEAAVRELKPES